jgi:hypothetical protein
VRATAWLVLAVFAAGARPPSAFGGEPTLEELEDAATCVKGGPEAWATLINAYRHSNTGKPIAEWALQTAIARHPGDPLLLLQKAALRAPHAAYPVLEELGRIPGWESRAREYVELLRLGLRFPDNGTFSDSYYTGEGWWSRLVGETRIRRALEIVEEGLRRKSGDRELLARRALTLALLGRDDEAMKDQESSGWLQVQGGRFAGIGDAWLLLGKPDLALKSYGGKVPSEGRPRMVYALLLSRQGNLDAAEKLLDRSRPEEVLLLLGLLLENDRQDRAIALQDAVVKLVGVVQGSNLGVTVGPGWGSREQPLARAIRWLLARPSSKTIPGPHHLNWSVEADLPSEAREHETLWRRSSDRGPGTDELLGILRRMDELRQARGGRHSNGRDRGRILCEAGRTEVGLAILSGIALGPRGGPFTDTEDVRIEVASDWCRFQTRREFEALVASEPFGFIAVRRLLADVEKVKASDFARREEGVPSLDCEVTELASKGRGVLAAVLAAYPRRTIGGDNRLALLAVIGRIGGPREVPFLLTELDHHERWIAESPETPWPAIAESSAAAIEGCLVHITGTAPEAPDRKTRRETWTAWWWSHASEIFGAK